VTSTEAVIAPPTRPPARSAVVAASIPPPAIPPARQSPPPVPANAIAEAMAAKAAAAAAVAPPPSPPPAAHSRTPSKPTAPPLPPKDKERNSQLLERSQVLEPSIFPPPIPANRLKSSSSAQLPAQMAGANNSTTNVDANRSSRTSTSGGVKLLAERKKGECVHVACSEMPMQPPAIYQGYCEAHYKSFCNKECRVEGCTQASAEPTIMYKGYCLVHLDFIFGLPTNKKGAEAHKNRELLTVGLPTLAPSNDIQTLSGFCALIYTAMDVCARDQAKSPEADDLLLRFNHLQELQPMDQELLQHLCQDLYSKPFGCMPCTCPKPPCPVFTFRACWNTAILTSVFKELLHSKEPVIKVWLLKALWRYFCLFHKLPVCHRYSTIHPTRMQFDSSRVLAECLQVLLADVDHQMFDALLELLSGDVQIAGKSSRDEPVDMMKSRFTNPWLIPSAFQALRHTQFSLRAPSLKNMLAGFISKPQTADFLLSCPDWQFWFLSLICDITCQDMQSGYEAEDDRIHAAERLIARQTKKRTPTAITGAGAGSTVPTAAATATSAAAATSATATAADATADATAATDATATAPATATATPTPTATATATAAATATTTSATATAATAATAGIPGCRPIQNWLR